jgi:hypothetical protein
MSRCGWRASAASRAISARDRTPSLARTCDTWVCFALHQDGAAVAGRHVRDQVRQQRDLRIKAGQPVIHSCNRNGTKRHFTRHDVQLA